MALLKNRFQQELGLSVGRYYVNYSLLIKTAPFSNRASVIAFKCLMYSVSISQRLGS